MRMRGENIKSIDSAVRRRCSRHSSAVTHSLRRVDIVDRLLRALHSVMPGFLLYV